MRLDRTQFLTFLETDKSTFELMNKGIQEMQIEYNANSDSEHYIADKSGTTLVGGYAPNFSVEQSAYSNEPIFKFVDKIRRNLEIGDEANTKVLLVYPYLGEGNEFEADQYEATIIINSYGGAGGDLVRIGYEVSLNGNPVFGTATVGDGKATFVPKEA